MEVCFDMTVHGQSSWNNTWPKPRPNTNMCDWVWVMEVCFDKMVHGQSSWNNTWPKPRPNTNMHDWVWVMEVCFDLTVHGQSSWKNIWPKPRPNTNDGTWSWSSLEQHMTQAKTQYQYVEFNMDDSDWLEMMVHGHHWNNIWPKSRPNTNICICRLIW